MLFLLGPTASGKTAVAVQLALQLDGEVISLDSMQIYRGLPILSAVPGEAERAGVPHHLLEEAKLGEPLDVKRFREAALERAGEIRARGRLPILAGGSGLYASALIEGLSELPAADAEVRRELLSHPPGWLHEELGKVDPVSAERLHPNDAHRLVRALEVVRLTGRPYSEQLGGKRGLEPGSYRLFGLDLPRPALHRRIEARAREMFDLGAALEVARATGIEGRPAGAGPAGIEPLATARQMLGIPQLTAYLAGDLTDGEAIALLARDTRRFARRQLTWFRRMPGIEWISIEDEEPADRVARRISVLFAQDRK